MTSPLYVVERKTTSEDIGPGSTFWMRTTIDPQIDVYIQGAKSLGYDVVGVLYDCLRKTQNRPYDNKKVQETPEMFERRLLEVIAESPDRFYQRGEVVRLLDEQREGQVDVWQTATQMRDARRLQVFPRNPDGCIHWSRTCDFLGVCSGREDLGDPMLFEVRPRAHEELDSEHDSLLTQSALRTFRRCQRLYQIRYEKRVRRLGPKAKPLRTGTSIHAATEVWWKTDGDLDQALRAILTEEPFDRAMERAMMIGYHARWQKPPRTVFVEKEFRMPLTNPHTGGVSRTFELGGRMDALCEKPSEGADVQEVTLVHALSGEDPSGALVE